MELIRSKIKVEWTELGEGFNGDYNEDDPEDVELLRFDISRLENGEWEEIDSASYCTQFPVSATNEEKEKALELIMNRIEGEDNIKHICQDLSWIEPSWTYKKDLKLCRKEVEGIIGDLHYILSNTLQGIEIEDRLEGISRAAQMALYYLGKE